MRMMQAAEDIARGRGAAELGATIGLFDAYDRRSGCRRGPATSPAAGRLPGLAAAAQGQVTMDDDLIIWLITGLGRSHEQQCRS